MPIITADALIALYEVKLIMELEMNSMLLLQVQRKQNIKDIHLTRRIIDTMKLLRDAAVMLILAVLISIVALSAGCKKKEQPQPAPAATAAPSAEAVPPEVMLNRKGMDLTKNQAYDEAIREFTLAIEKYPNFEISYSNRASVFLIQNKFDKAMEDLEKASSINPDNPVVHYNFASLYSLQNQPDRSLASLDKALKLGFNDYDSLLQDPDLNNTRKSRDFKKLLKKHKVPLSK
jgi:tetratricopeptide (TPR) repeat protein